jgi:hypothetical protein
MILIFLSMKFSTVEKTIHSGWQSASQHFEQKLEGRK